MYKFAIEEMRRAAGSSSLNDGDFSEVKQKQTPILFKKKVVLSLVKKMRLRLQDRIQRTWCRCDWAWLEQLCV